MITRKSFIIYCSILFLIGLIVTAFMLLNVFPSKDTSIELVKKHTHFKDENKYFVRSVQKIDRNNIEYYRIELELNEKDDYNSINYKGFRPTGEITEEMKDFYIKDCNSCLMKADTSKDSKTVIYKIVNIWTNQFILITPNI